MMSRSRLLPITVVTLYLSLAIGYGLITPIYEGPDEIGHVLYVKHLAEGLGMPVQTRAYAINYGFGQEGSQPPLYYALNAALVRVLRLSLNDLDGLPPANPFTTCGRPGPYNVALYRHDPRSERFPYQGAARAVHVMRLFSALLGALTVAAVYVTARLAFPRRMEVAPLAAVLVAFNPQFVFMSGLVNNDNLVNCLSAFAIALTMVCLRRGFTWRRVLGLGLICGLATMAKVGGLMTLAFAGMALLVALWRQPKRFIGYALLLGLVVTAATGWWFARNWVLYGELTGLERMTSIYGPRRSSPAALFFPELVNTFRSYWGTFSCNLTFPRPMYWLFVIVIGTAIWGAVRTWHKARAAERRHVWLLLVWLILVFISYVRWNWVNTSTSMGRLFFQANAAICVLLGYGLARLASRPRWVLAGVGSGLLVLALAGAFLVLRPAFALPPTYPAASAPTPPQPLPQASFGDAIQLLGYEVSPYSGIRGRLTAPDILQPARPAVAPFDAKGSEAAPSLEPGQELEVSLFLQATRSITEDYALAVQLMSPISGDDVTLVNFNTLPGGGNYPTYAWEPGEVIVDRYRLQVPERVERAQAWRVMAIVYRLSDGRRLPVTVAGQPAGKMLGLGMVRVGASETTQVPLEARLEPSPLFGETIRLEGLRVCSEGERLWVEAWWRAVDSPPDDYTALVHLYDAEGMLLATGDMPPLEGAFPTSLWEPGDLVVDTYDLSSDEPSLSKKGHSDGTQGVRVGLGWYDPGTGIRLSALCAGDWLAHDVYSTIVIR